MHFSLSTALITSALIGAIVLTMRPPAGRLFPVLGLIAAAVAALIAYRVIQLSVAKFRIDVVIPAVLAVSGGVCWSRASTKPAITAATVVAIAGLILLLSALRVFSG